jgi:hypothetical protein
MNISLEPAGTGTMTGTIGINFSSPIPAQVEANGSFRFENVTPGEYQLSLPGFPGRGFSPVNAKGQSLYVKEARLGSIDLLTDTLVVSGPVSADMQIVLSANTGQISGIVRDERQQPVSNIHVALLPDRRERHDLYRGGWTAADGSFSLRDLPAGTYRVFAIVPSGTTSLFDPAVMRKFEPLGQSVTVGESSHVTVELKVRP